jgi:hypothetical protein
MIPTPPAPTMEHDGEPTDARVGGGHQDDETELAAKAGAGETPLPDEPGQERADLAAALVPLMPAARAARDQLLHEGAALSRDALATRLRRNGTPLRNTRVSELLAAVKAESEPVNGHRPKASV